MLRRPRTERCWPFSRRRTMGYHTRVLSKQAEFPSLDELALAIRAEHPNCKLAVEEGDGEEWETLLLSGHDDVEIALIERNCVTEGSVGQDEIADLVEEIEDCRARNRRRLASRVSGRSENDLCFPAPRRKRDGRRLRRPPRSAFSPLGTRRINHSGRHGRFHQRGGLPDCVAIL